MKDRRVVALLATLASGVAWFASQGVHHVWPLAWLVPLPLLLMLPDVTATTAAFMALGASGLGALNLVFAYPALPPVVRWGTVLVVAAHFCLVLLLWRLIARRMGPFVTILAYPLLLVSTEYAISLVSPHGSAGNTAYSQMDVLPLIQIASITGIWGISFLLALVPSALAMVWRSRNEQRGAGIAITLSLVPLAAALVFGLVRLKTYTPGPMLRVGVAALDSLVRHFDATTLEEAMPVVETYAGLAATLARGGATVVVLPEKLIGVTPEDARTIHTMLGAVARDHDVTIVAGLNLIGRPVPRNVAVMFTPDQWFEYDKRHLVPGLEADYRPGATDAVIQTPQGLFGMAICKDLDFLELGRDYSRAGIGVLFVPAWDFTTDAWLHSRMAILRGVEGGYAIVRAAARGRLTVSDAEGRIVAEVSSDALPQAWLTADVRLGAGRTFYERMGDWFAWGCAAAAIGLLLGVARQPPDATT